MCVIPVVCTEYAVLQSLVIRDDFKKSVYRELYALLVESFEWDKAVGLMSQTDMMKNGKPKSLEKIYKELLANARYDCLHNKERFGAIYKEGCSKCEKLISKDKWNQCEYWLKGVVAEEVGVRIYVRFPVYVQNTITDKYVERCQILYQAVDLQDVLKEQINRYRQMCRTMHIAPII